MQFTRACTYTNKLYKTLRLRCEHNILTDINVFHNRPGPNVHKIKSIKLKLLLKNNTIG